MADLGLLAGLAGGIEKGLTAYRDTKDSIEDRAIKRKMAALAEAKDRATITDLMGSEQAAKVLAGIDSPEFNKEGSLSTGQKEQSASGLIPSGMLSRKQRDVYNEGQKALYSKTPQGKQLSLDPNSGLYKIEDRVLTEQENRDIEKENLDIETKKSNLLKSKSEAGEVKPNQGQAALYGKRMQDAENIFGKLSSGGYNRAENLTAAKSLLPNSMKSSEQQQQDQAERNFVNATLRRESGSAINPSEFTSAEKQYFPRAGDAPEVLANKQQNRERAIEGMKLEAGGAWGKLGSQRPQQRATAPSMNPEDSQALQWANANPTDPRAKAIKVKLGVQ